MRYIAWPLAASLSLACSGGVGSGANGSPSAAVVGTGGPLQAPQPAPGQMPGTDPSGSIVPEAGNGAGLTPLRRLSNFEYDNSVRDLLGDSTRPAENFPRDSLGSNRFTVGGVVSSVEARAYYETAQTLAADAVARLPQLFPCDPASSGEMVCRDAFISDFGKRVYRRPLTAEEASDLRALYDWSKNEHGNGYEDSIRVVLQAMLQSPNFLYHQEVGSRPTNASAIAPLTAYERASRLSYFLWSSTPDDELLSQADANALQTPEQVAAQARRLMQDARFNDTLRSFHTDWLELGLLQTAEKDPNLFPEFDDALRDAMLEETARFTEAVFSQDGRLQTLLTANFTFASDQLAPIYGLPQMGSDFLRVVPDPAQGRAGLLTQPAFLAMAAGPSTTSPVRRGKFVRERLLCQDLPPPAPDVDTTLPVPDENVSAREQFEQHSATPACAGCHELMDPIGFAFEHFDAIGRYRTTDGGQPVDASGKISGSVASDATFTGVVELAQHLAASEDVNRCVSAQWFRFATGRMEGEVDAASLDAAYQHFVQNDLDMRELLVALTQTRAFLFRSAAPGEVLQ